MRCFFYGWFIIVLLAGNRVLAQVNPQNGAAQVNIPLYSYSDAGSRLGVSASLVYRDGNGLMVSELASDVGTGWDLNFGGAIVRVQHGEPDDQRGGAGNYDYVSQYVQYVHDYYPDGYLYSTYSPSDNIDNGAAYTPYSKYIPYWNPFKMQPKYTADREQDVFAFSFNGRSGQFVIGKNKVVRTLEDSRLKIDLMEGNTIGSGVRTSISQFTITDESGIQYVFKDMKYSYVCVYDQFKNIGSYGNPNVQGDVTQAPLISIFGTSSNMVGLVFGRDIGQRVVEKWYLSQIVNPLTGKKITFNYTDVSIDINTEKHLTYAPYTDPNSGVHPGGGVSIYWQRYKVTDKRLSSVVLSNAERIDLEYDGANRIDLPGENTLTQLKVSNNNKQIYSWNFTYGYLVGLTNVIKSPTDVFSDDEKQWARLCLLTVRRTGTNGVKEPPYLFDYNMGAGPQGSAIKDLIPPMFSIFQDHWGYYNRGSFPYNGAEGTLTAFYTCADLKTLLTFAYGGDYRKPFNTSAQNGIIKSVTFPGGGMLSFSYEANNSVSGPLGGVRVKTTSKYDGIDHANDVVRQYKYINPDGTSSGWGDEAHIYFLTKTVHAYNCSSGINATFPLKEIAGNYVENGFMTGTFGFTNSAAFSACLSSALQGYAMSMVIMVIIDIFSGGNDSQDFTVKNYMSSHIASGNPLPRGYARTEVTNLKGSGDVGKTVYEFTNPNSPEDHGIEIQNPAVPYSNKQRYAPWAYGLPKKITVFDTDNKIVKQTVNHYSVQANYMNDDNFRSNSWETDAAIYNCSLVPTTSGNNLIRQEQYFPLTGHSQLDKVDEYVFNSQQQSTVVTTSYEYDNNYQLKHKYFYNSKGEKVETYYYYPYNYYIYTGAVRVMNTESVNMINPVLSTETYINKNDGAYLIGAVATDFGFIANGDIKPRITYAFQNPQPVAAGSQIPFNPNSVVRSPVYFKQVGLYDYDLNGNLVQTLSGGNKLTSTIYDYDGKLSTASVVNASYNDIGYTSFEAEDSKAGSWVNAAAIVSDDARTGSRCFNLSDPSNSTGNYFGFGGLNNSLTYIVSFWGKNSSACIKGYAGTTNTINSCQGASGWTQGVTVNGWTYYEKQVSGVDKIGMSGTGLVDEFRIYPAGAQMATTTYAPLIGKTSECDASGRVTYYLYDDLGRLIKVSDDGRNVIRTYEYNYKQ